ncbi:helix-turn-helix domain-containing protein [Dawidia soli]|uniref:Helix-turn-helix transcriptional regulator n=1 Tax=Dawidia soli TaxID=2782352 RepID=A0AAP2DEH9_9BACT|nr:helix-turn-helix domain-containing protein [Dawidia soli]MBT1689807.1 helix-turn-helix transcriptional regulator [Dawidia soli]
MLSYQKYGPRPILEPFIVCYYDLAYTQGEMRIIQSPPSGYAAIIFNLGDPYAVRTAAEKDFQTLPDCILAGQQTKNYRIRLSGNVRQVGIVFKPTAIATLFDFSMRAVVDKRINLDALLGDQTGTLHTSLKFATDVAGRLDALNTYFTTRLEGHEKRVNVADMAAALILENTGNITVERLMEELCVSRRHLERKFLEKTGLTPKQYCRIVRMAPISNQVAHASRVDWQDMVFQGGFHDQNHFIKDFKALNDLSPGRYLQEHAELTRLLDKKKE